MNTYRFFGTLMALVLLMNHGGTALAHHSYGPYQIGTEIQFEGEVTKVGMANPHSWIYVDAENENGELESWALEGAGVRAFQESGFDGVAIGDQVGVTCVPLRSGDTGCYIRDIQIISTNRENPASNTVAVTESIWERFSYPDQRYRANFPQEPTITEKDYLSEYGGTFPSTIYEASEGDSSYSLTVIDFSNAKQVYEDMTEQINVPGPHNFWLYTQMGAIAYAARQFRLRGGEVIYDAWHAIDFIGGHKLSIINEDNTRTYAGIYRHADRLFVLEADLPEGSASAASFLESLHILDDEGERVRYLLQPDHSRVRLDIEAENRAREENGGEEGLDRTQLIKE